MRHYKTRAGLRFSLAAIAILVPLTGSVNPFGKHQGSTTTSPSLKADGIPIPPLPPPKGGGAIGSEVLVADGIPIPPLPPPKLTLVADGIPIPPLPPPKGGSVVTLAA